MPPEETTSGAGAKAAESEAGHVAQATTAPSQREGAGAPVQEQTISPAEPTDEQIERLLGDKRVQARIYQSAQSMNDRAMYQERLRQQGQAEQSRQEAMDDEEYGSHVRTQQRYAATGQQMAASALARTLQNLQTRTLGVISDESVRKEMAAKSSDFQTYEEFAHACVAAEAAHQAEKQLTKREKELREAVTKELQAEQDVTLVPQLGRGTPAARVDVKNMTSGQLIAAGFQEKIEAQRRKRAGR